MAFEGHGAVSGLVLADAALARAIGGQAKLALSGTATASGDVSFDTLSLTSPDLDARYSGLFTSKGGGGSLAVEARDLNRFAPARRRRPQRRSARDRRSDGAEPKLWRADRRRSTLRRHISPPPIRCSTASPAGDLHLTGAARSTTGGGSVSAISPRAGRMAPRSSMANSAARR